MQGLIKVEPVAETLGTEAAAVSPGGELKPLADLRKIDSAAPELP
jgi:hypothetical protein